jgi:hypothetical protein
MTAKALKDTSLDPADIRRDAEAIAGTGEWDDTDIVEPLAVLTDSLQSAGLSDAGRARAARRLRELLSGYIGVQFDGRRYPEICQERIVAPIVITGLPRCGTTLLHGLMSADPRHRAPAHWQAVCPSPPPDVRTYESDPRRAAIQAEFDEMIKRSSGLQASLPYSADLKAECHTIAQPSLRSVAFYAYFNVASYQRWYLQSDHTPLYRFHHRALQQFQWRGPQGRWVLKSPPHLHGIDKLVAAYPDLRLIQNHRDPKKVMASVCALYHANQAVNIDTPDKDAIGSELLDLFSTGTSRMQKFRAARPDVPVVDVYFDELNADPLGTVREVYDALGTELTPDAVAAMEAWLRENARDKRPVERHHVEEFGLTPEEVDERFADYRESHPLLTSGSKDGVGPSSPGTRS